MKRKDAVTNKSFSLFSLRVLLLLFSLENFRKNSDCLMMNDKQKVLLDSIVMSSDEEE